MAESYENFYYGGQSSLDPSYGDLFTGYRVPFSQLGATTNPQTANQIAEVSDRLNQGLKVVELQPLSPEIFESIPKQHLEEMNRLSKLTGSETSVHAPVIDPAGFSREGWSEGEREAAERQIFNVVERSHQLNPSGNIPVTIHGSALPGTEYRVPKEGLPGGEEEMIIAVNQETGQMVPLRRMQRYYPEEAGGKSEIRAAREELDILNRSEWSNNIIRVKQFKKMADELIEPSLMEMSPYLLRMSKGSPLSEGEKRIVLGYEERIEKGKAFLDNTNAMIRSYYHEAYKFGDEETRKQLEKSSQEYRDYISKWEEISRQRKGLSPEDYSKIVSMQSHAVDSLVAGLSAARPQLYKPVEEFAIEKASQTLGNVAFKSYEKYGGSTPLISIENVPVGMAISRAEDLKQLIEKSRDQFVKDARAKGISESEARSQAEKIIGATWDVGHINLLRKGGFGKEKIVEETKKIAPYVKHVHLADNFGYNETHLPIGMGEVPVKEMMKELEKKGFSGKQIIEAGNFLQHFRASPLPYTLEALGSPLYSAYMQPFWNQVRGTYGNYSAGYGTMLPEQHYSMYGGGFSTLPTELGGQMPSKQSRFAGTPTE